MLATLCFLHIGVEEGNPLIRLLLHAFSPLSSLLLVKCFGMLLGIVAYLRSWNFSKLNLCYILLVVWNLTAIFVQLSN
jgi:uncharacterized protein DUF5658